MVKDEPVDEKKFLSYVREMVPQIMVLQNIDKRAAIKEAAIQWNTDLSEAGADQSVGEHKQVVYHPIQNEVDYQQLVKPKRANTAYIMFI